LGGCCAAQIFLSDYIAEASSSCSATARQGEEEKETLPSAALQQLLRQLPPGEVGGGGGGSSGGRAAAAAETEPGGRTAASVGDFPAQPTRTRTLRVGKATVGGGDFAPGSAVKITGLRGATQHNGRMGVVLRAVESGRLVVRLDLGGSSISVKPANAELVVEQARLR
jgi:hypothetical protein